MFVNYFKTAFRNLRKNKTNSFLNIFGLAIGIACAGLIFLWVEDEVNFDNRNVKKDRLYQVLQHWEYPDNIRTGGSTPGLLAPTMKSEIPGVVNTCRSSEGPISLLFTIDDKSVYASGRYVDSSLFSMFTLPFAEGNAKNAFAQLHSIVITEKTARKFFAGDKNVVGKTLKVDNKQDYIISGVLKDLPENSSLQFEWMAPFEIEFQQNQYLKNWGSNSINTYVELDPSASPATVNKQLYNYIQLKVPDAINHAFLFSMNDWRLYGKFENGKQTGGRIEYVRMFSLIAWIILFIACINFMNLATARSEKRAREVGVRKVLGAEKKTLIAQFIGEALFMAILAAFAAMFITTLALPAFNTLVEKNLSLGLDNPTHLFALMLITITCGLVAGSYPSFYLSSFNPVFVLKGIKLKSGSAAIIRKGLVVLQFTVSIVLIIGTIIIYQQIQHVKNRQLGFDKDNLIEMKLQGDMSKNFPVIRQELMNTGVVENVALTSLGTIYGGNNSDSFTWQGKEPNKKILISQREVTPEFIATSGIDVIEGRDFQQTDLTQIDINQLQRGTTLNVMITESMAKLMGKESAIGKTIQAPGPQKNELIKLNVVGVVKDFVYGDMYGTPDPVIFFCLPQFSSVMNVRIKAHSNAEQALAKIEAVMKKNNPAYPFEYKFVDDQFNQMFLSETLISKLSRLFAALAIIISCLGLFGLAAYTAERRTKEIGIRKVLGASAKGLAALLSKDFIKLVGISCIIAFPVAWWMMYNWLQDYAYRIQISWWIFIVAGVLAILIALLTVSFQAIKAAVANPVKSLRTE